MAEIADDRAERDTAARDVHQPSTISYSSSAVSNVTGTLIALALATPMSHSIDFEIVCPNNHEQTVSFTRKSFEEMTESGGLLFHCNTCDTDWNPSSEQIGEIRKKLSSA